MSSVLGSTCSFSEILKSKFLHFIRSLIPKSTMFIAHWFEFSKFSDYDSRLPWVSKQFDASLIAHRIQANTRSSTQMYCYYYPPDFQISFKIANTSWKFWITCLGIKCKYTYVNAFFHFEAISFEQANIEWFLTCAFC